MWKVVLASVVAFLAILIAIPAVSYVSAYNYGNEQEQHIKAVYTNNQNVLSQYTSKIKTAAQIPSMQTDDLVRIFNAANSSRYGDDGSQAGMQWIREQNPLLDQSTYKELQRLIAAGRDEFQREQTRLIDAKRAYETSLGYLWRGFWLRVAGYPKVDLAQYKIVMSDSAVQAFETGVQEESIQLR